MVNELGDRFRVKKKKKFEQSTVKILLFPMNARHPTKIRFHLHLEIFILPQNTMKEMQPVTLLLKKNTFGR
ncbi:MAG: hypothetical protein EH225_06185 [Calditrichaeota bacterium]|nr:hypothetical protein [Calditrichota bacterium]RQW04223.1 MAG: hypothetical protein EH225_06185 [Calditrichota bacterium]